MHANILHTPEARFEAVSILQRMSNSGHDEATDRFRPADVSSKMYAEMFLLTENERQTMFAPIIELYEYVKNRMDISSADLDYYFARLPVCQKSVAEILLFVDLFAENVPGVERLEQKRQFMAELLVIDLSRPESWVDPVIPQNEAEMLRFLESTPCDKEEAYKLLDIYSRYREHREKAVEYAAQASALYLRKASVAIPLIEKCCSELEEGIANGTHPILRHEEVQGFTSCMFIPSIMGYSFVRVMGSDVDGYFCRKYPIRRNDYIRYGVLVDTLEAYKQAKLDDQKQLIQSIKALGDKNRLLIINALNRRPMHGHELVAVTRLAPATVSHHVNTLVGNGFVDVEKVGTSLLYRMNPTNVSAMITRLQTIIAP